MNHADLDSNATSKRIPEAQERRLLTRHLTGQCGGKPATYRALVKAGMFGTSGAGNVIVTDLGKAYCARWHLSIQL